MLTILVSTCNRCEILLRNIKRMIRTESQEVRFIICDNASQDSTWECLKSISDKRLKILHNDINYGFENFWLISEFVETKYFMFVNDRDYIYPEEITLLCENLRQIENVDFISNEQRDFKSGYYNWKDAIRIYFQSRHPGTLIYSNEFCKKHIDVSIIRRLIEQDNSARANNYLVFQLLKNVDRIFLNTHNPINQPLNRERIPKVRKEYYTAPYMSLEYRVKEYDDWIEFALENTEHPRVSFIMLEIYKDSLMTVTWEYYFSMKIPGMARRNLYENHAIDEWKLNGVKFFIHVLKNSKIKKFKIRKSIVGITIDEYIKTIKKIMEW